MRLQLAFGKAGLWVEVPDTFKYRVLEARSATPLADPVSAIEAALDDPIGCLPLRDLALEARSAAISVCDITRPAPNAIVLPPVLARLEAAGIERENIVILIATGLHRPATEAEIREIVGPEIASAFRVENHYAREFSQHHYLGDTTAGTPVFIDDRFVKADIRITLGFIEPHLMLGFSGGRKLVAPGLAAQETIKVLHSSRFMRDERAAEGSIEDNPLHRELVEIARMAHHDFLVDVALGKGSPRPIAQVFAGEPVQAHARGVEFVSQVMLEELDEPADAVITTAAGYPLDLTYYQAIKGITAASHIVKPGGRILLIAECSEGVGADEFAAMVKTHPTDAEFLQAIEGAPVTVDQWQLEKLALASSKARLFFYLPGVAEEYRSGIWGKMCDTPDQAVRELLDGLPPSATIAVIPEGPYVLARARPTIAAGHGKS